MIISPLQQRLLFYATWVALACWQGFYTELLSDEAYYWVYSQDLAWGYFDHPPMVAVFIKMGCLFFDGEIGVRFIFILSSVFTIYVVEKIVEPKNFVLFAALISSLGAFHLFSFGAVPDGPLLLFAALFILLLQKEYEAPHYLQSIIMGLLLACMLLSKYHALLIIPIIVLSNYKLVFQKRFWTVFIVAFLGMLPHIHWQWTHDWVSIRFHLFERDASAFLIYNVGSYALGAILFFAPFVGMILLYYTKSFRVKTLFDKSMKVMLWGFLLFFLLASFRGHVEPNWLVLTLIPITYIGYSLLVGSKKHMSLLYYALPPSLLLIFVLRVCIATDALGPYLVNSPLYEFYNKKDRALKIRKAVGDKPVFFINSYQQAALYEFYTGQSSISFNEMRSRKNQYDICPTAKKLNGERVAVVLNYYEPSIPEITCRQTVYSYYMNDYFFSMNDLQVHTALPRQMMIGEQYIIGLTFSNYEQYRTAIKNRDLKLCVLIQNKKREEVSYNQRSLTEDMLENGYPWTLYAPAKSGSYTMRIGIKCEPNPASLNSKIFRFKLVDN